MPLPPPEAAAPFRVWFCRWKTLWRRVFSVLTINGLLLYCCAACMDVPNPYSVYKNEFDNNVKGNKAPVGIYVHSTATQYLTKACVAPHPA